MIRAGMVVAALLSSAAYSQSIGPGGIVYANPSMSAPITAAMGLLPASGGEVFLPCGTYVDNVTIARSSIKLVGASMGCVVIQPSILSQSVITIDASGGTVIYDDLSDFTLSCPSSCLSSALYITGTNINDYHRFQRIQVNPNFQIGINVDGRLIYGAFSDVYVVGTTGNACQFDSSVSGGFIFHDSFRNVACNGSTGGWGLWVKSPSTQPFHTLEFDHINAQGNTLGGIYVNGVEEGGIANSYVEGNGPSYGIKIEGTYAMAFNITGNLVWSSGVAVYNHATLSQGIYSGNRANGSAGGVDFDINTPHPQSNIVLGPNYSTTFTLAGHVVVVPVATGTITLH